MIGFRFIKVQPTTYLLQYRGGKIVREGLGHSFFYYAPTTSLVAVRRFGIGDTAGLETCATTGARHSLNH